LSVYCGFKTLIMKKITTVIVLLLLAAASYGQADAQYKAVLKKMFEVSGTEETYKAALKQIIGMFKQQHSNVPEAVWADFEKEFSSTSLTSLVEMLSPVYQKYMTKDDLQKMVEFYQTPVGKKYAANTPLIMQESMQIGQQWGMKIGQQFQEKLKEKGY
jgi:uncharacterized protein